MFRVPPLSLHQDRTVNVRMRFYLMLPNLKRCLKLPRDHALLQKLEATVRLVISSELDTEAAIILREAVEELDQVNVSMEVVSGTLSCLYSGLSSLKII